MRTPLLLLSLALAPAASAQVKIAEVYGGGGNAGAPYQADYIVLHNTDINPVDVSTWSIQYASVQGTTWTRINLTGTIPGGGYYFIRGFVGTGNAAYPSNYPVNVSNTSLSISGRRGRVALSRAQTTYTGNTPQDPYAAFVNLEDFVGWGGGTAANTPSQYEGATFGPDMNVSNSIRRAGDGATDTNNNGADFAVNDLSGGVLPVELVAFTAAAQESRIRAAWETASETSNAGFRLDVRATGTDAWRELGTVGSKASGGTTLEASRYAFTSGEMPAGRYDVRLSQRDLDGAEVALSTVEVEIAPAGGYEAVVRGTASLVLRVADEQRVSVRMVDAAGREVARLLDGTVSGETTVDLPQGLAAGVYFVRIEGARFATTRSIVVR